MQTTSDNLEFLLDTKRRTIHFLLKGNHCTRFSLRASDHPRQRLVTGTESSRNHHVDLVKASRT